jgi:DNA-binding transcriptional LysR family regulator
MAQEQGTWDARRVTPEVDLKHMRYFVAVADEGTFTGAAERLGMTQPALSRAIRTLEDAVGTALFVRRPQGAVLTEAGRQFCRDARCLVEAAEAALNRAARFGREEPHLRVTARACDVGVLHRLVDSYTERYPDDLPARAAIAAVSDQAPEVRAGEADVTLLRSPFDHRGMDSDLLRTDARVALLPRSHPLAGRDVIHRGELAGEAFPVWPDLTPAAMAFWTGTDVDDHDWRPGPVVHDTAQFSGSIRLGQAVGFMPRTHLPEHPTDGTVIVPVVGLSGSELRIAWASAATSPDVARFVRHATEQATEAPEAGHAAEVSAARPG